MSQGKFQFQQYRQRCTLEFWLKNLVEIYKITQKIQIGLESATNLDQECLGFASC